MWAFRALLQVVGAMLLASPTAAVGLTRLSTDPYTNTTSFHRTEVEPDSFAFGSTLVAAFQVGRFSDGGAGQDFDKDWIVCDNTPTSPFYGTCYVEYDDFGNNNQLHMARSTDGGLTWGEAVVPGAVVIGGQPLVQPNGTVVLVIDDGFEGNVESFLSIDGGGTYTGPIEIAPIQSHPVAGNLRSDPLPSAELDELGRVY